MRRSISGRSLWLTLACAGLASLVSPLVGCGLTPGGGGSLTSGAPKLSCVARQYGHAVDVITTALTCQVTGAPASDTAFTLRYTVSEANGGTRTYPALCAGALHNGSGSCAQEYSAPAPFGSAVGSVSGETTPDQRPLGPLTPTERQATPSQTQLPQ